MHDFSDGSEPHCAPQGADDSGALFTDIARDIDARGYSIRPGALPAALATSLWQHVSALPPTSFVRAGIGRNATHAVDNRVRTDEICWIDSTTAAGSAWLRWTGALQTALNRRLFLGLFSFESHFAHYAPGDFYKKHQDAFQGEVNRVLSLVVYLNPDWRADEGGELLLYTGQQYTGQQYTGQQYTGQQQDAAQQQCDIVRVSPDFATLVVFLSEQFPHEVLPASRDRFSIAGWFRVNNSAAGRADLPI